MHPKVSAETPQWQKTQNGSSLLISEAHETIVKHSDIKKKISETIMPLSF